MKLFSILGALAELRQQKFRAEASECNARLRQQQEEWYARKHAVAIEARKGKIIETEWKQT